MFVNVSDSITSPTHTHINENLIAIVDDNGNVGLRLFLCYGKLRITGIHKKKSFCMWL